MAFQFTSEMETTSNQLWAVLSAIGAGLCFLVLITAGMVSLHPLSRKYLDRVSFRMAMYALAANTLFGTASVIGGELTGPSWGCGLSIFVLEITLEFSNFMLFCVALNLQLVVVHGYNGRKNEKFYLIGSVVMSALITIPAYAAGQYGWDRSEKDCWYTNDNRVQRLGWQIGTQLVWMVVTVLGETCASTTVMIFMWKHQLQQKRRFARGFHTASAGSLQGQTHNIVAHDRSVLPQRVYATNYKSIIVRVAFYPLVSCVINLLSIFTAVHSTVTSGIVSQTDYNILLLSDFLYGARPVVYALLAASDPALVRGVKSLVSHVYATARSSVREKTDSTAQHGTLSSTDHRKPIVVTVELETIQRPIVHEMASPGNIDPKHRDMNDRAEGLRIPQSISSAQSKFYRNDTDTDCESSVGVIIERNEMQDIGEQQGTGFRDMTDHHSMATLRREEIQGEDAFKRHI